jgi:serine O-acetyltransferase
VSKLLKRSVRRVLALPRHAVALYRLSSRLLSAGHPTTAGAVATFAQVLTGAEIEPGAALGEGFVMQHSNGVVIASDVRTGRDCKLYQQVTLGTGWGSKPGVPILGDRVTIFAGAKVLGGVTIGDRARIGANAVVLDDVPADAVAVGIPARVVSIGKPPAWEQA